MSQAELADQWPPELTDPMEYAVKAETHEEKIVTLSEGFPSRAVAEDFPVRLAKWRRVWVERIEPEHPHP
jgi:hypothetical protein